MWVWIKHREFEDWVSELSFGDVPLNLHHSGTTGCDSARMRLRSNDWHRLQCRAVATRVTVIYASFSHQSVTSRLS